MNRRTALLLALAALMAHVLAIHHDTLRNFAGPYDSGHASYHLARTFAETGGFSWGDGAYAGSPQLLWWLLLAGFASLGVPLLPVGQALGVAATLATVALSSRFATTRIAGIVSPVLLVFSGGFAAMAASGTDGPLVALLGVAAFHGHQRGYARRFALCLTLFVLARPEAIVLGVGLLALSLWRRHKGRPVIPLWTYLPAAALGLALALIPRPDGISWYGPWFAARFRFDIADLVQGSRSLWTFLLTSVTPLLLVFPFFEWVTKRLSGIGRHAFALGVLWLVVGTWNHEPSSLHFAPALPIVFLAVQQGMILLLDSGRKLGIVVSWTCLLLFLAVSALTSKYPGDLGPFPLEGLHRAWMTTEERVPLGAKPVAGRLAVEQEVRTADAMRTLGNFLRLNATSEELVLSAWPGALADFSQCPVDDLTFQVRDRDTPRSVLELLAREPAFIVPGILSPGLLAGDALSPRISRAVASFDPELSPKLVRQVAGQLEQYWVLTLPISSDARRPRRPYHLLARRGLGIEPKLGLVENDRRISVEVLEPDTLRMPLLADLQVWLQKGDERRWFDPRGEVTEEPLCRARTGLLVRPQERGPMTLWQADRPAEHSDWEVHAQLVSPGRTVPCSLQRIGVEVQR